MKTITSLTLLFFAGTNIYSQTNCNFNNYTNDQADCCQDAGHAGEECDLVETVLVNGLGCVAPYMLLVYSDDFTGTSIDETFWSRDYGQGENNVDANGPIFSPTKQWFAQENVIIENGICRLKAIKGPLVNKEIWYTDINQNWVSGTTDFTFQSAGIRSKYHFMNGYGTKIRSRVKIEEANRARYTFWTFGNNLAGNRYAEIDIFEIYPNWCYEKDKFVNRQMPNTLGYLDLSNHFRVKKKFHTDKIFACQTYKNVTPLAPNWRVYEAEYNMYSITWRTGADIGQLNEIRKDWFWFNTLGQSLSCTNFNDGQAYPGIQGSVTRIPKNIRQDIRFSFYVQLDKDNQGDNDYLIPKYQDIDWIEVYQELPCLGDVAYNSVGDLGMVDNVYNTKLIHDGDFNNVVIAADRALKIISTGTVALKAGTTFTAGSFVDIESNGSASCSIVPWSIVRIDDEDIVYGLPNHMDKDINTIGNELYLKDQSIVLKNWKEIIVYPNPGNSVINLDLPQVGYCSHYIIRDKNSKVVLNGKIDASRNHVEINIKYLAQAYTQFPYIRIAANLFQALLFKNNNSLFNGSKSKNKKKFDSECASIPFNDLCRGKKLAWPEEGIGIQFPLWRNNYHR